MITFLRFVLLGLIGSSAYAQSSLPACQGSDVLRWTSCFGTTTYFISGDKYVGEFKDGNPNGQGAFISPNGAKYVGEIKDGKRNGQGIEYTPSGSTVSQGRWENGNLAQSFAIDAHRFPFNPPTQTASAQPSTAERDRLAAVAQSQLPECSVAYKHNCVGTESYSSGYKYVGEFKDNKRSGQGTFTYADGNKYEGEWRNDKRNGQGTETFADGDKYVGEHKDNQRHGQGIEYTDSGAIIKQGRWESNGLVQSFAIDTQRFTFNSSITALAIQPPVPDPAKAEIDRLAADLEASRKRQQDLEEQLRVSQASQQKEQVRIAQEAAKQNEEKLKNFQLQNKLAVTSPMTTMATRRALVIGNDTYKSVPKLANAREDARTIATNLTSVGYQVTLKLDVTEKEMKAALRTFAGQVQGGDEVLFFFAGHGVQLGAANFLLPIDIIGDSEAQVKDEAIQLQRVLDDMSEKKAKFTLAMVDACRDNPFKSTGRAIGGRGLGATTAATGQMVIFSAGTGQQALDKLNNADKNKNGLFTRVFAQEMQKPNQSVNQIIRNVRNQVAELAKSVGQEQVPAIYDQVLGEFYFKVPK